jgi:hypothetical protein
MSGKKTSNNFKLYKRNIGNSNDDVSVCILLDSQDDRTGTYCDEIPSGIM